MTCREALEFLMAYLAGELPPDQRARFERHLGECPPCVAYLRTYEETIRLGRACAADPAQHAPLPDELVQAIVASQTHRPE